MDFNDTRVKWFVKQGKSGDTLFAKIPRLPKLQTAEFMRQLDDAAPISGRDHPLYGIGYSYRTFVDGMEFAITDKNKINAICEQLNAKPSPLEPMQSASLVR